MPALRRECRRLELPVLAHTRGNLMRMLAMPKTVKPWSPTSWSEKLIKIGAKVISHSRDGHLQDGRGGSSTADISIDLDAR